MEPNNTFLAMEVNDLPLLIDDILEPMVERKPTHCGKAVQNVENFYNCCPSEPDVKCKQKLKTLLLVHFIRAGKSLITTNLFRVAKGTIDGSQQPFLAMEVKDFPPGRPYNPNDILIDVILGPMVEGKSTAHGKDVQIVENFNSLCPSGLVGAKALMENKKNSLLLFVRRIRNGKKVSRAAKGGRWRARGGSEEITTRTGIKAKKGIFKYTPKDKSEECGLQWIMEEYVLDRRENFEDYALLQLRVARSGKWKRGEEPSTSGKRTDVDNAAEEKNNSRHGEGPKSNPPLPIVNCSQETSDTGSLLPPPDAAELERDIWQFPMENDINHDPWLYQEQSHN
ncbi:hypothetical protein MRB53_020485 [Persea americana]|uniref:Uncharacterized protein n=1 Tax=Persea americana TaxID=3435 RepID=A0ACC2L2E9_PERAE|nr:hypothetical protein MRB53_020485 [Persea americana]